MIGQMMEPVEMPDYKPRELPPKTWATTGWSEKMGIPRRIINSLYIQPDVLERHVAHLMEKYAEIEKNECLVEEQFTDDASVVESLGCQVAMVDGNRENIKITTPFDIKIAEALLNQ